MDRQQGLTAKQQRIYDYLRQTILEKGFPPSVREICAEVGLSSSSTVHAHLSSLEEKGYIRRDPSRPRAIEITGQSFVPRQEMISLPVISTAAAEQPVLAEQSVDDSATVKRFYKETGRYRLQPENDEMEPIIVDHVQIPGRVIGLLRFMGQQNGGSL